MKNYIALLSYLFIAMGFSTYAKDDEKVSISLQASFAKPTGYLYNYGGNGYGIGVTFLYKLDKSFWLTGYIGDMGFDSGDVPEISAYYLNIIQTNVGFRYGLTNEKIVPYVGIDAGVFMSTSAIYDSYGWFSTERFENSNNFTIAPIAGLKFPIGSTTIDVTAKYNVIFVTGGTTDYTGINAGVYFQL